MAALRERALLDAKIAFCHWNPNISYVHLFLQPAFLVCFVYSPMNGGRYCVGEQRRFKTCNTKVGSTRDILFTFWSLFIWSQSLFFVSSPVLKVPKTSGNYSVRHSRKRSTKERHLTGSPSLATVSVFPAWVHLLQTAMLAPVYMKWIEWSIR